MPLLARERRPERRLRHRGVQVAVLPRVRAVDGQHEVALVLRPADADGEQLVLLLVDECGRRPQLHPPQLVRPLGDLVLGDVEQRLVVVRPLDRCHPLGGIGMGTAGDERLDVQRVLPEAGRVGRIRQQVPVVAHLDRAEADELEPFRHLVLVEHHELGRVRAVGAVGRHRLAAVQRVLLPLDGPRVVVELPVPLRHVEIGLLDAGQHFLVERVTEWGEARRHRLRVGVLGLEVLRHLGIGLLAKPEVRVVHGLTVPDLRVVDALGHRRRGPGRLSRDEADAADDGNEQHGETPEADGHGAILQRISPRHTAVGATTTGLAKDRSCLLRRRLSRRLVRDEADPRMRASGRRISRTREARPPRPVSGAPYVRAACRAERPRRPSDAG